MKEIFLDAIKIAYGLVGVIGIAAYLPTIKDLYLHKKPSANLHSYYLWTLGTLIAMLYSFFILDDFLFRLVSAINFVACLVTLILIIGLSNRK